MGGPAAVRAADRKLATLPPRARQAFLLVAVEEFRPAEAARAMDVSEAELQALIEEAGRDIARQVATEVVIIEDEPLIALDLVQLVNDLGHRVVRVARTAEQAVEATRSLRPGLVLADIHLADGSSGLDAVNEILRTISLPVVFVTAFPQRLLTGTRPEPTFLVTKPFQPQNVKASHQPGPVLRHPRPARGGRAVVFPLRAPHRRRVQYGVSPSRSRRSRFVRARADRTRLFAQRPPAGRARQRRRGVGALLIGGDEEPGGEP